MNVWSLLRRGLLVVVVAFGLVACGDEEEVGPQSNQPDTGPSIQQSPAAEETDPD